MTIAYLSLGSNIGDREHYLSSAIAELDAHEQVKVIAVSPFYETEAWGLKDQADFLNICCSLDTSLSPDKLLTLCQSIESKLDRQRLVHWGPRTIDLDIIFYGNDIIDRQDLRVPHPYFQDRAFVLVPLNDIAPDLVAPKINKRISDLLKEVNQDVVRLYQDKK